VQQAQHGRPDECRQQEQHAVQGHPGAKEGMAGARGEGGGALGRQAARRGGENVQTSAAGEGRGCAGAELRCVRFHCRVWGCMRAGAAGAACTHQL
jgi:hypothetical protein